jgi:hypothetical protein
MAAGIDSVMHLHSLFPFVYYFLEISRPSLCSSLSDTFITHSGIQSPERMFGLLDLLQEVPCILKMDVIMSIQLESRRLQEQANSGTSFLHFHEGLHLKWERQTYSQTERSFGKIICSRSY